MISCLNFLTIESQLAKEAESILSEIGIDLETVIKMTLKRIVRDRDISFLMTKQEEVAANRNAPVLEDKMSKGRAVSLFKT